MALVQTTLKYRERKTRSGVKEEASNKSDTCQPSRSSSVSRTLSNYSKLPDDRVIQSEPTTPTKRRFARVTELASPPKIKCPNDSALSSPSTTSSRDPLKSPITPSTYLSQLTLKSPSICLKEQKLPPKSLFSKPEDILGKARVALHTHTPSSLPGREEEIAKLNNFINDHLESGTSGSLYISGAPGTGKTACLTQVMEQADLKKRCRFISINCTALKSPKAVFARVTMELSLKVHKNSGKSHLEAIEKHLLSNKKITVMIFDEIDQLGTRSQSVLYTVFEWPAIFSKGVILIGIANALDLTDRMLPRLKAKVTLAPQLLHFAPYSRDQLFTIFKQRLKEAGADDIFQPAALQLLASKVSVVNGDARRALDTARRLVENETRKRHQEEVSRNSQVSSDLSICCSSDVPALSPRKSPRKPMALVPCSPQTSDIEGRLSLHSGNPFSVKGLLSPTHESISSSNAKLKSPEKLLLSPSIEPRSLTDKILIVGKPSFRSPSKESSSNWKENASPDKKSSRKLDFQNSKRINAKLVTSSAIVPCKPPTIDVKSVMTVMNDVYGTSQALGRSVDGRGEELPLQQKFAICSLLLILHKSKNKDITVGKLHEVYRRVCTKRRIDPLDQGAFFSMLELIEARGIVRLQVRGKPGRLVKVCLQWIEDEVVSALQDRELLASIVSDVSCLS